jgi:3-methyladenine DNA glycosylase AlkD
MNRPSHIIRIAKDIRSRLDLLNPPNTTAVREVRKEFSRQIAMQTPVAVTQLALHLLDENSDLLRFFTYELVSHHKPTAESLSTDDLLKLGRGLKGWVSVDCFATYLSGPMWSQRRLSDKTVAIWARSPDRWWRRTALVSTVALSRRGKPDDLQKVARICAILTADRDDMVVKALSWAVREVAKKHPEEARNFLTAHKHALASRVTREVNNKLRTGLKTPRSRSEKAAR